MSVIEKAVDDLMEITYQRMMFREGLPQEGAMKAEWEEVIRAHLSDVAPSKMGDKSFMAGYAQCLKDLGGS